MLVRSVVFALNLFFPLIILCQQKNWHQLELGKDSVFGVSTEKAYYELLRNKRSTRIIVAVIDNGIDTSHEDVKHILWKNKIEMLNGRDDDKNGFIDDFYGWNYIGGNDKNVEFDNLELTRLVRKYNSIYEKYMFSEVPGGQQTGFLVYRKMLNEFQQISQETESNLYSIEKASKVLEEMVAKIGNINPSSNDFNNYEPKNDFEKQIKYVVQTQFNSKDKFSEIRADLNSYHETLRKKSEYHLNLDYDPRKIVGDDYKNSRERFYGNNNVYGFNPDHGTHVAGIIAASRNNNIGIEGIADNVMIMSIRVVPDGDERDKDVSNAIRYAADNGAKIINMSFGKAYSWDKQIVDEAVKYAMAKDVLIVHAAGNDGKNLDDEENGSFPNKFYLDSTGEAKAWINVGASGWADDSTLAAPFSNYGKTKVDVFAPGVQIYSTVPGNKYEYEDGTSMAAPVVSGLAALIRGYYPKLTAIQVKDIIMRSVVKRDVLKDKCVTGGVVNAYNALKLAATYK